jgi:hypothetical protein
MEKGFDEKKLVEAAEKQNGFLTIFAAVESYIDDQVSKLDHEIPMNE